MTSFGQRYVIPAISSYQKRYPDVAIELTLAQRIPDLLEEGYDVSLVLARELRTPVDFSATRHVYSVVVCLAVVC